MPKTMERFRNAKTIEIPGLTISHEAAEVWTVRAKSLAKDSRTTECL